MATTVLVTVLAFLGCFALIGLWLRALLRALTRGAEVLLNRSAAEAKRERGDLTGYAEVTDVNRRARALRLRATAELAFYTAVLAAPLFTPYGRYAWAVFGALWGVRTAAKRLASANKVS
jgi:hypothetical protein